MAKSIDNRLLGLKIAYYRKKKRLTQAQLAEKINISIRYMSKIECGSVVGSVSLPVLNRISNELNVSIDTLITTDEDLVCQKHKGEESYANYK